MLAIASFSGCDRQEPTCSKCENQTDTVYVSVPDQQEDSIMNLLCHKWKIVEFVDDWNGTRTVPEGINDNF
ncbi:MAG: hypothetical protein FWF72_03025, partial [Paludibacter sp.]|nr:hypothetical protein [Paludibacter sp.]